MPIERLPNEPYDFLLYYLSQKQEGDWAFLEKGAKGMGIAESLYGLADRLILLACLDLDLYGNRGWCVPPPTLVETHEGEWFWTGFRTLSLLDHIAGAVTRRGEMGFIPQYHAPTSIYIRCPDPMQVKQIADENHVAICGQDAPQRILFNLPPVRKVMPELLAMAAPFGKVEVFYSGVMDWITITPDESHNLEGTHLVRYGNYFNRNLAILENGNYYRVGNGLAHYYLFWRTHVHALRYQQKSQYLIAPFFAGLPSLYGRSIVLHSGRLPEKKGKWVFYPNVTQANAELAAQVLGQSLEVMSD